MLLVLDGTIVVRLPEGEETLERGDIICFPLGPAGAHKVMNRTESTARMMMFSRGGAPAVSVYPDSDKIAVGTGDSDNDLIFKRDSAVVWSEGEDGWQDASSPPPLT